jgi:hypothetical protein
MGIGFGPGSNMIRAVNKQRSARKKRSLKESSESTAISGEKEKGLKFKKASPEQLEQIRNKMKAQNKKNLLITIAVICLLGIGIIYTLV